MAVIRDKWRSVLDSNDEYRVSRFGDVYSMRRHNRLAGYLNPGGYPVVCISIKGKRRVCLIHRLVYEAFNGPLPVGMVINHIDGNKKNFELGNLEAVTPADNTRHAWKMGLVGRSFSEKVKPAPMLPEIPRARRGGHILVAISTSEFLAGLRRWRVNKMNAMTAAQAIELAENLPPGGIGALGIPQESEIDRDMMLMELRDKHRAELIGPANR